MKKILFISIFGVIYAMANCVTYNTQQCCPSQVNSNCCPSQNNRVNSCNRCQPYCIIEPLAPIDPYIDNY